jgi:hypothetical protein
MPLVTYTEVRDGALALHEQCLAAVYRGSAHPSFVSGEPEGRKGNQALDEGTDAALVASVPSESDESSPMLRTQNLIGKMLGLPADSCSLGLGCSGAINSNEPMAAGPDQRSATSHTNSQGEPTTCHITSRQSELSNSPNSSQSREGRGPFQPIAGSTGLAVDPCVPCLLKICGASPPPLRTVSLSDLKDGSGTRDAGQSESAARSRLVCTVVRAGAATVLSFTTNGLVYAAVHYALG